MDPKILRTAKAPVPSTPSTPGQTVTAPAPSVAAPATAPLSPASTVPSAATDAMDTKKPTLPQAPPSSTGSVYGHRTTRQPGSSMVDWKTWSPVPLRQLLLADLEKGFDLLTSLPPAVTFFGGARIKPSDPYYGISKAIGALLADKETPVRTGAGPGIMSSVPEGFKDRRAEIDAATKPASAAAALHPMVQGATEKDLRTQGFRIALPFEQEWSEAIDVGLEQQLFPFRKLSLYENTKGLVVFPGGYGTLEELFEVLGAAEAQQFSKPVVLVGKDFWNPIMEALKKVAVDERKLIPADLWDKLVFTTDDPEVLLKHIEDNAPAQAFERPAFERAKRLALETQESVHLLDQLPPAVTFLGGRRLDDNDATVVAIKKAAQSLTAAGVPLRVGSAGAVAQAVSLGTAAADPSATVQGMLHDAATGTRRDLPNLRVLQTTGEIITHKEVLTRRSSAYVALPGGFNTLAEVTTILTQIQTGHMAKVPVVLVGKDFWQPVVDAWKAQMLSDARKTIAPEDLELFTITDDAKQIAALTVEAGKAQRGNAPVPAALLGPDAVLAKALMKNPGSGDLPPWFHADAGDVGSPKAPLMLRAVSGPRAGDETRVAALPKALRRAVEDLALDADLVRGALDLGVDEAGLTELLKRGAGVHTFTALRDLAPFSEYRGIQDVALAVLDRFGGPAAESIFQRMNQLARAESLMNPDALKTWIAGLASPGAAGEGVVLMALDAHSLLAAGHRLTIEEHATGRGDIIDETTRTVYQHKRIHSGHVHGAIRKATAQLLEAPAGYRGVAHIDLRGNQSGWRRYDDATVAEKVAGMDLGDTSRLDRIRLVFDDRVLTFDKNQRPVAG